MSAIQCMRVMPQQILIWCCCLLLVRLVSGLTGDNVCNEVKTDSETIEYIVTEPVTYRIYTWCLKMPPRCSKYTTIMKERIKTKLQINNHTVDYCCDGYVQLETYCVPECNSTECPNMKCNLEKKCICSAGYYGQRCHRSCRPGFWGENCASRCVCNGEPCNLQNGDCIPPTTSTPIPVTFTFTSNDYTPSLPHKKNLEGSKEFPSTSTTSLLTNNYQISAQLPTTPTISLTHSTKTGVPQEIQHQEMDFDSTAVPLGISLEDMQTTLLPEDEVMIVYPSINLKSYLSTKQPPLEKITRVLTTISSKKLIQKYLPSDTVTPSYWPTSEKMKNLSMVNYLSKIREQNIYNNKLTDSNDMLTTEQTRMIDENKNNKNININKMNVNIKKYYGSTIPPIVKNIKYSSDNLLPKKSNGLPPPVPDGSDNSLQIKNNSVKNITSLEENGNNNHIIIKTNDIQRDMEELNNNNFSYTNGDTAVNSSLVKAKWSSALDAIDFSSPSIVISISVTVILFLACTVVMITHCTKSKTELTSSSFYDSNVKTCHDNALVCSGHYSTPGGQQVFFCPAFSNTYAFELAQELREAHYDHPRSARCLISEPVYAELQY
ncbi:uncharacterized protein LOC142319328 isoform X2 [Lycorma delicatula]|uniref:uncharacterized protein LOC142319328 isoform X2 n=1 Tax=Lycorma delicatula TaxID=130591 RepID=UPI003F5172F4